MIRFKLIFLTLILCNALIAQSDFQDGYILVSEHDTIYGKINNKDYNINSLKCEFIKNNSDSIRTYYPNDIYGYRFSNGKFYISKTIKLKDDHKVNLFLEFLIKGKLSIYFYQDINKINHYYASKDSAFPNELQYSAEIKNVDGNDQVVKLKRFVGVLSIMTDDCPEMKDYILKISEPNHEDLINFANRYNKKVCPDLSCTIYEKKMPIQVKADLFYGSFIYFKGESSEPDNFFNTFGLDLYFCLRSVSEKFYLGIGLVNEKTYNNSQTFTDFDASVNYISSNVGLSPLFSAGFDYNSSMLTTKYQCGLKYQYDKFSFFMKVDIKTVAFIIPYATSQQFGIQINIR